MNKITIGNMIASQLKLLGADGLVNLDIECGCGIEDLAPCGCPKFDECQPAKRRVLKEGEYIGNYSPGDLFFEPYNFTIE